MEHPDTVALLAPEGKRHVERALAAMEPSDTVYAIDELVPVETPAEVRPLVRHATATAS
jgi:hypothetical protein